MGYQRGVFNFGKKRTFEARELVIFKKKTFPVKPQVHNENLKYVVK